jgi:hypothetical protein
MYIPTNDAQTYRKKRSGNGKVENKSMEIFTNRRKIQEKVPLGRGIISLIQRE